MKLLAIDPSMSCTGWAVLEGEPGTDGKPIDAGVMRIDGTTYGARVSHLATMIRAKRYEARPDAIVVETPFATARGGPKARRSAMTLPSYGMAVAAALLVAHELAGDPARHTPTPVLEVPSDEWSVGIPKGKRLNRKGELVPDDNKGQRVALVQYVYGLNIGGSKADAGGVADAILLARWVLRNKMETQR